MIHRLHPLVLTFICLSKYFVSSFVISSKCKNTLYERCPAQQLWTRTVCSSSANPFDLESPEERAERMKLVRQIQKSFYTQDDQDDDSFLLAQESSEDPTIYCQVPLWRVQWTELPGYQNVLNCHVPHYTHMFNRIVNQPKPWLFGHIVLPLGSENLNNPSYRLLEPGSQATTIGTLMQVTDYQQLEDGRLALIVQALERFQVIEATQHVPYAIASVQLLPDDELAEPSSSSKQEAVRECFELRDWEFRPTLWEEAMPAEGTAVGVSPLVNYDARHFPDELNMQLSSATTDKQSMMDTTVRNKIMDLEYDIWVALDKMLFLLEKLQPGLRIPVPSQLLGLLPINTAKWPADFKLEEYTAQLQTNNAMIGTSTKSPFVRVSENQSYSPLRRAARLSYSIWIILDSINLPGAPNRQDILEETSIHGRMEMARKQLEAVNSILRQSL